MRTEAQKLPDNTVGSYGVATWSVADWDSALFPSFLFFFQKAFFKRSLALRFTFYKLFSSGIDRQTEGVTREGCNISLEHPPSSYLIVDRLISLRRGFWALAAMRGNFVTQEWVEGEA